MGPYGTIWDHMGPYGTIWDHMGPKWSQKCSNTCETSPSVILSGRVAWPCYHAYFACVQGVHVPRTVRHGIHVYSRRGQTSSISIYLPAITPHSHNVLTLPLGGWCVVAISFIPTLHHGSTVIECHIGMCTVTRCLVVCVQSQITSPRKFHLSEDENQKNTIVLIIYYF